MRSNLLEMAKFLWAGALVLASTSSFVGCADDPSPVGSFLLPQGDRISVDSAIVLATESSAEKAIPFSFANSRQVIAIGKSGAFASWGFLRFSGIPDSLSTATVQSAEIRLQALYHLGDSLGQLSFTIHKALQDWNRTSFIYDSLATPGIYDPSGSAVNLGSFGDAAVVQFPIDTALVREWALATLDTNYRNHGVVLEPTNTTVIKGFRSFEADSTADRPVLTIRYMMSGSAQVETLIVSNDADKFVAGASDTTFLRDSSLVAVRGGAAYRGVLGFNLSSIPKQSAIHRALLDVTVDAATSTLTSNEHDSLFALYGGVPNPVQPSTVVLESGRKVYRFSVTEFVQAMVRGADPRIRLSSFDEENSVGQFMINGSASADPALRPKLTVLFSPTR